MKKFITLLLIFFSFNCFCQTVSVNYIEKRTFSMERLEQISDFEKSVVLRKKYFTLINSDGVSLYKFISRDAMDSVKTSDVKVDVNGNRNITNTYYGDKSEKISDFYFKDFSNSTIIFKMLNGNKNFDGKDSIIDYNWSITDEVQQLNGYNCKKAKCKVGNTDYIAWFTEDIPINDGPNKFNGLPGLIVYVSNPYFEYYATKIVVDNNNTLIERPPVIEKTYTFLEMNDYVMKNIPKSTTRTEGNTTIKTYTIGQ